MAEVVFYLACLKSMAVALAWTADTDHSIHKKLTVCAVAVHEVRTTLCCTELDQANSPPTVTTTYGYYSVTRGGGSGGSIWYTCPPPDLANGKESNPVSSKDLSLISVPPDLQTFLYPCCEWAAKAPSAIQWHDRSMNKNNIFDLTNKHCFKKPIVEKPFRTT